jgi:hypothetical protein
MVGKMGPSIYDTASSPNAASYRDNIERALSFIARQSAFLTQELPDDLPVAIELVLPQLLAASRDRFNFSTTHLRYGRAAGP